MALKRTNDALKETLISYQELVHNLRSLPEEDANVLFKRLRTENDPVSVLVDLNAMNGSRGIKGHKNHNEMGTKPDFTPQQNRFVLPADWGTDEDLQTLKRHPNAYPTIDSSIESFMDNVACTNSRNLPETPDIAIHSGLDDLNIRNWSKVRISNEDAAKTVSLFLQQEHPIIGLFDEYTFIGDLVSNKTAYCSKFLVSSLLAFSSQGYTSLDPSAFSRSYDFEMEAKAIWKEGKEKDEPITIAALVILYEAIGSHGENHIASKYLTAAEDMCKRMRLFGVEDSKTEQDLSTLAPETQDAYRRAAWGAFDVLRYVVMFLFKSLSLMINTAPILSSMS
jgi:hypothetical protein